MFVRTVLAVFDAPAGAASAVGVLRGAAEPGRDRGRDVDVVPPWSGDPGRWNRVLDAVGADPGARLGGPGDPVQGEGGPAAPSGPGELDRRLRHLGVPPADAAAFVEAVARGACLVAARLPTSRAAGACAALDSLGALDLAAQSKRWAEDPDFNYGAAFTPGG